MSLKMKQTKPAYTNNRNSGPNGASNIPMYLHDRKGDYAIGELMSDFGDLKAGAKVAVILREINQENRKKKRPEIRDFKVGGRVGTSNPYGQVMGVVAENSWLDSKQTIEGLPVINSRWIRVAVHDVENPGPNLMATGLVSVERIRSHKNAENEEFHTQNRYVIQPEDAYRFSSEEEFRATAKQWLEYEPNAQLIVRITDHNAIAAANGLDTESDNTMSKTLRLFWDKDNKRPMDAEASIEYFLDGPEKLKDGQDNPDYQLWRENIKAAADEQENYTFDVVVSRQVKAGKVAKENIVENPDRYDADGSLNFRIPNPQDENREIRAFMHGTMFMRSEASVYATDTYVQNRFAAVYTDDDLPGARDPEIQKYFDDRAIARGNERFAKNKADRADKPRADEDNQPGPGLSMS